MMELFTVGNILTLGITFFAIFVVRYLDRKNRSMDLARDYGKRLKDEFSAFADGKALEVKDNGLVLDVQRSAVKVALDRLTQANKDLTEKADAIALRIDDVSKIGDRISAYDISMEELIRMTNWVEDNLKDLRKESVLIDETVKKIKGIQKEAGELEKNLGGMVLRFEQENTIALEKTTASLVSGVENTVEELRSAAKLVEQQVEEHREAIENIEAERDARLEQDTALINKTLEDALEKAAGRSNQFEEAALTKLKEEALLRINRFKETVEEKFREYHENARSKVSDIQDMVKSCREEWNTVHFETEAKQRAFNEQILAEQQDYRETWNTAYAEIEAKQRAFNEQVLAEQQGCRETWNTAYAEIEAKQRVFNEQILAEQQKYEEVRQAAHTEIEAKQRAFNEQLFTEQQKYEEVWQTAHKEMEAKQRAFNEQAFGDQEEYQKIWQTAHTEIEAKQRAFNEQLSVDQEEYRNNWQRDLDALDAIALSQRKQWEAAVTDAQERLEQIGQDVNTNIAQSEEGLLREVERRLEGYREEETVQWKRLETMADDVLKLDGQLRLAMEDIEARVRRDFGSFEEGQKQERDRVASALLESVEAFRTQIVSLEQELTELKNRAYDNVSEKLKIFEDDFFADISRRSTDVDRRLAEWQSDLERKLANLGEEAEAERRSLEISFKDDLTGRIEEHSGRMLSDLERLKIKTNAFEEKIQNGLDETESRVSGLSGTVEVIRREFKEFNTQTRLFEKTEELRNNLERAMESLRADLSGLEERRAEAARLETEFIKIRRLEDEVNAKMTRFLTEKSHLDIMEKDFERLISTSQRVEERLKDVIVADDTLQNIQVSLRKLEDATAAAEEKYQRVENKNQILEETNRGIERNFQILEETEMSLRKCRENIKQTGEELDTLRPSIEELAAASEKAQEAEKKLHLLDTGLIAIETRMEKMQVAREWLARTETRFEDLNRKAEEELKLLEAVFKDEVKKAGGAGDSKGAPSIAARENVVKLARQGWSPDVIARTLKIGRGEVELILEMGRRD